MRRFEFPPDIPMDKTHQLDQSTARFQSVKNGLPELIKNAKDQYARLEVRDKDQRQIVVLIDSKGKALGVVDFAGATAADFNGWQTWASRTAGRAYMADDIEAGHGNGGKSFMVRGSTTFSYIESCAYGLRTRMGFDNQNPSVRYFPGCAMENGTKIWDVPEPHPRRRLEAALADLDVDFGKIPEAARQAFEKRQAFTAVYVGGIREWQNRRSLRRLVDAVVPDLLSHGQAALSIETCSVWVVVDGELVGGRPLEVEVPPPFTGFEALDPIPVPEQLPDPSGGDMIPTGTGGPKEKFLQLRTSEKHLRMSEDLKALNVIRVRNERNVVANWPLARLAPMAESSFIFGELRVPGLEAEHVADSHRDELADTPLARALEQWVTEQVEALAAKLRDALVKETRPEDRTRTSRTLSEFRELMRDYLESSPVSGEQEGEGEDGDEGNGTGRRRGRRWIPGSKLDEIILEPGQQRISLASGTKAPLVFRCYERDPDGERYPVLGVPVELCVSRSGMLRLTSDGDLHGISAGTAEMWLRNPDTGITSNKVEVEVVQCTGVDILGPPEPLKQGQWTKLLISFHTSTGPRDDLLVEGKIDEIGFGRLSRHGVFTAGMVEGTATVRVRFGPARGDVCTVSVEIGAEVFERSERRAGTRGDVPWILLCGEEAPGMDEYPPEQRTHPGGDRFPTIIEEPQFPHVVWINHNSKESVRVRRGRGPTGVGGISTKTFYQFLALKCFDILKRLKVRQEIGDAVWTEREFTRGFAQAEIDCSGFIDTAYELAGDLYRARGQD